jgi:prolyl oligopeptidase
MKKLFLIITLTAFMITGINAQNKPVYPKAKKVDTVDTYFGTKVADPYRWLEDDKSAETAAWVKEENTTTNSYLSNIPFREQFKERLTKIWNYAKYGVPFHEGNYYFFYKNDGLQNQSVLYVQEGIDGTPSVLIDPNKFSTDGTTALADISVSHDAKYLAYTTSTGGSDWNDLYVVEIPTGKKLIDKLSWLKFSGIAWYKDGFYYSRYDEPKKGTELSDKNEFHKVYFHKIGDLQSKDQLVYENKEFPLHNYTAQTTDDEKYLLLYESEATDGNALYYKDLIKGDKTFKLIAKGFDYEHTVVDDYNDQFIVLTNNDAPKKKLVLINPENPEIQNWKVILPEKQEVLQGISLLGGKIIAEYMKDANSKSYVYSMNGDLESEVIFPDLGTASSFSGKKEDNIAFYSFTSFTYPSSVFKYDITTNTSSIYFKPDIDFDASKYITEQVFYTSKDGTKIPMFIVHKKDIVMNGENPTLLYGYGGFNISLTPSFSLSRLLFLENGGIYAMANLRGGGEYGEEWHQAGTKLKKQNVFDDFIAAAEYLIKNKYTTSEKLAIQGGSNGGLLIGACMTQRPDLFKVAIPQVGVMDMLRFHKFTIGWAWTGDYGSSDDSIQFKNLYSFSPLHNIKEGVKYPITLVTTADHDDRVVPAHSFKFIATLQEKQTGSNPVLVRIETMAGHGAGKPTSKSIEEATDIWSFIMYYLGMNPKF